MLEDLNPLARESLLWTREQLSPEQRQWLAALPLVRSVADFTIVHATLDEPGTWGYLINADDARASIVSQTTPLCFFGHTHRALIYEKDEGVRVLLKRQVSLQKRAGYLINPGSVGRACGTESPTYAIYDQDRRHVQIRSLGGDLECLPLVS